MTRERPKGEIIINEEFCKGCVCCVDECPDKLLSMSDKINGFGYYPVMFINKEERCNGCKLCAIVCPDIAIVVFKEERVS